MTSYTVSITLEFDELPQPEDIYKYLEELIADKSLRCDVDNLGGEVPFHAEYY